MLRPAAVHAVAVHAAVVFERAVALAAEVQGPERVLDAVVRGQGARGSDDRSAGMVRHVQDRDRHTVLRLRRDRRRCFDHAVAVPVAARQRDSQPAVLTGRKFLPVRRERVERGGPCRPVVVPVPQPRVVNDGVERLGVAVPDPGGHRVVERGGEVLRVNQGPGRVSVSAPFDRRHLAGRGGDDDRKKQCKRQTGSPGTLDRQARHAANRSVRSNGVAMAAPVWRRIRCGSRLGDN